MNIWTRTRGGPPPRFALGLWLPIRKLVSSAYSPNRRDRAQLLGGRPFFQVFGGGTGDVTIPAGQWVELTQVFQTDFIAHTIMVSTSQGGTSASPGVRLQIRDMSTQPGRQKRFSLVGVNDVNMGGTARRPFFLRKPYRFVAGHTILVKIQNLQAVANNVQVVIAGVMDE